MPLFGQILAALYQEDIVDEEDIRAWYNFPGSKGENRNSGTDAENFKQCWDIGTHLIKTLDDQDSDEDDEESASEEEPEVNASGSDQQVEDSEDEEIEDDVNSDTPGAPRQQGLDESEEESTESEGN